MSWSLDNLSNKWYSKRLSTFSRVMTKRMHTSMQVLLSEQTQCQAIFSIVAYPTNIIIEIKEDMKMVWSRLKALSLSWESTEGSSQRMCIWNAMENMESSGLKTCTNSNTSEIYSSMSGNYSRMLILILRTLEAKTLHLF